MKTLLQLGLAGVLPLTSHAAITEDFDSYVLGSNLHGQGSWKGWDNIPGAGALVADAHASSGTQAVNITRASDLVRVFSGVAGGKWTLSIKQYIPSTSTGDTYFLLLNQYNDLGPYNWSVQIQNNMGTGKVISDMGDGGTLDMVKDAWVEYRIEIDFADNTVKEYYNNQFLNTHAWQDGTGLNELAVIDLYANNADPVYYDDLNVAAATSDPFTAWIGPFFPGITDPMVIGEAADPDHDGLSNLMEYVLQDGDPTLSSTAILPTASITATALRFTFHRRASTITGTTQTFQYGSNLRDWTDVPITNGSLVTITADTPILGIDEVVVTVPQAANTKLFGRFKVTKP
ncbi:MAG: hypothetical protein NTW21_36040 [Verrucomicrobia bacterium]|nr:hypothetical protein [Verrucomicrobiota bacterium]